jgi:hypothetical protein
MTRLLLPVVAWRFVRRRGAAAAITAVAMPVLYHASFAYHHSKHARAVGRVLRPIEHKQKHERRNPLRS